MEGTGATALGPVISAVYPAALGAQHRTMGVADQAQHICITRGAKAEERSQKHNRAAGDEAAGTRSPNHAPQMLVPNDGAHVPIM